MDINSLKNQLEIQRKNYLQIKFKLLKNVNATCYKELKNDDQKYIYRKLTKRLRYINKVQDAVKKHELDCIQLLSECINVNIEFQIK